MPITKKRIMNWRVFVGWAFIFLLIMLIMVGFYTVLRFVVLLIFFLLLDIYIYHTLKVSFGKVPPEGLLAVFAFGFSAASSFIVGVIFQHYEYFEILWIPTIAAWFLASLYSLFKAPEDLVSINEP